MNAPFPLAATSIVEADLGNPSECQRIADFVCRENGSVFHLPRWLKAIEQGTGNAATGLIAERAGAIIGWLPVTIVHSPLFGRALVSSGFAVEGGPLVADPSLLPRFASACEELAQRWSCSAVEWRGGGVPDGWNSITGKHSGFVRELAEDNEAQLLAIPRKQRAEVRKGLKGSLTVSVGQNEADRAAHYACYAQSVHNLGTPVFPRALFDAVLDQFEAEADILTVWNGDAPVASVLTLYHLGAALPFWGGGVWAARGLRANERMYYALMCHAREMGCLRFDFGRSKTGSGPYNFKKNFGFEPQPLEYACWNADGTRPRDVDPTSAAYARKIALWKKLPLPVANTLGPFIARGLG